MVPGLPKTERAEQRHGDGLEKPYTRSRDVVEHPVLSGAEPQEDKGEVACPPHPDGDFGRDTGLAHRPANRRLQNDAYPRQHEEDGRGPGLTGGQAARRPQGMEKPGLREGEEARERLVHPAAVVAAGSQPRGGGNKRDAEGLVPPGAPVAREPPVEDVVREPAHQGRVVPELRPGAEERAEGEGADELPELHDHGDGGEDAGEGGQAAVGEEEPGGQGGEEPG